MSLYLTIFDGRREIVGWVFGHYSDFALFREYVAQYARARLCPTLMQHTDSDGAWEVHELSALREELRSIADEFARRPPMVLIGGFEHTITQRANATTLHECFHNVDGINLFEALIHLCDLGERLELPILFQ